MNVSRLWKIGWEAMLYCMSDCCRRYLPLALRLEVLLPALMRLEDETIRYKDVTHPSGVPLASREW